MLYNKKSRYISRVYPFLTNSLIFNIFSYLARYTDGIHLHYNDVTYSRTDILESVIFNFALYLSRRCLTEPSLMQYIWASVFVENPIRTSIRNRKSLIPKSACRRRIFDTKPSSAFFEIIAYSLPAIFIYLNMCTQPVGTLRYHRYNVYIIGNILFQQVYPLTLLLHLYLMEHGSFLC